MSLFGMGSIVGLVLGLIHSIYVYRVAAHNVPAGTAPDQARGLYFAVWTLALWLLFGSYVLILWLTGVLFYTVFKAFR